MASNELTKISVFDGVRVRKILFNDEWCFSIIDICGVLVESTDSGAYWRKLKQRLVAEGSQVVTFCHGLKLEASDGKKYTTDCANTEGIFRIIQSIPSPKAEPFKQWLAKVGKERLEEIENPELGIDRARALYAKKGYPKEWISKRFKSIDIRHGLTDEFGKRGARNPHDYAILTNEVMKEAFGIGIRDHKAAKGLGRENLRDHMTDLELVVTMLAEVTTTQIVQGRNSEGMQELKRDVKDGGAVAGRTRKDIERQIGRKVVSKENFLSSSKRIRGKKDELPI
jgi:DNA-damage-inducible protein D